MNIDARTPVIVGVGQYAERIDDVGYRAMSSVELASAAAKDALADCGADAAAVAAGIDVIAAVRQFEISGPMPVPLGRSTNYPRSVARRIGTDPARAILEVVGGQGPQKLVAEMARTIAKGDAEIAMVFGSDAVSTERYFTHRDDKPDFSEQIDGQLEDRGYGFECFVDEYTISHGLIGAPVQYGLLENARRNRVGLGPAEYRTQMAELFAPMSEIAAKNPLSASPTKRTVAELTTITGSNRMICDPYPRLMVARDQVNMGAAALLMSVGAARRLGVPEEKWVYLRGHADLAEQPVLQRSDIGASPAALIAVREALRVAGVGLDDIAAFDLYSCFAMPVFTICDGTGLATDDPRGLTITGGLPFFGGPGNNYSMHAIAEIVNEMRDRPGQFGLVGANGGIMSKYSVGVYSTDPAEWARDYSAELTDEVARLPKVAVSRVADGPAAIETYTVRYDWPTRTGIVIGRLDGDSSRFLATTTDEELVALMSDGDPLGHPVMARSEDGVNRVAL